VIERYLDDYAVGQIFSSGSIHVGAGRVGGYLATALSGADQMRLQELG
jgi:hypothetical protein